MEEPKYLIKFVKEEEYAKYFYSGCLYMNAAGYYLRAEGSLSDSSIRDIMEATISQKAQIYKGLSFYIYCMFSVFYKNIEGNSIKIANKMLKDFGYENGYAVVVEYEKFKKALTKLDTKFSYSYGLVNYKNISQEDTVKFLLSENTDNLFVKSPRFASQQEFRIVVEERAKLIEKRELFDEMECNVFYGYEPKSFIIKEDIRQFSKIYSLKDSVKSNEFTYLGLE